MDLTFITYSGIAAALVPLVVDFLKRASWSINVKKYVAILTSMVGAVATTAATYGWEGITLTAVAASAAIIIPAAQALYKGIWDGTAVSVALTNTFDGGV